LTPTAPRPPAAAAARPAFTPSVAWALFGVAAVFAVPIARLAARGIATVGAGLAPPEWFALAALTALFVYTEGVRALQRRWGPHMIRRTVALASERRVWVRLLAPLYALSLVAAPRRELARAWVGLCAIVAAVLLVRALPDPWRGIIDLAVAVALTWGSSAIAVACARIFRLPASPGRLAPGRDLPPSS
jgi:hypothetical protein